MSLGRRSYINAAFSLCVLLLTSACGGGTRTAVSGDGNVVCANRSDCPGPSGGKAPAVPVAYTVAFTPSVSECDGWVFPNRIYTDIPVPDDGKVTADWAHKNGGIDHEVTRLKVTLQGKISSDVVLSNPRIVSRIETESVHGTNVNLGEGCGGVVAARGLQVLLGAPSPKFRYVISRSDGTRQVKDGPFDYKVASDDPEVFDIIADDATSDDPEGESCNCLLSWKIAIDWSHEGKTGVLVIDDHGKPFHTNSTYFAGYQPDVVYGNGVWQLQNPNG